MAAIEYGSYYWCVILEGLADGERECVHLHADQMEIDPQGTLLFRSAGRRPAGSEPPQNAAHNGKEGQAPKSSEAGRAGGKQPGHASDTNLMIYMAFAPGTWITAYAAKLQDGTAAAVEHWHASNGQPGLLASVPTNSGAAEYSPRE